MRAWAIKWDENTYESFSDTEDEAWSEWLEGRLGERALFEAKGYRCVEVSITEVTERAEQTDFASIGTGISTTKSGETFEDITERAEPVAWMVLTNGEHDYTVYANQEDADHDACAYDREPIPLYTHPTDPNG